MTVTRVLVCGSRTFNNATVLNTVLDGINLTSDILIIQGGARGADHLAGEWATAKGVPMLVFAANWNQYGKRAGFIRNSEMLNEGKPDVVWAFVDKPLAESKGTKMMVDIARKASVQCYVVQTEGE